MTETPNWLAAAGTLLAIWIVGRLFGALIQSDQAEEIAELKESLARSCSDTAKVLHAYDELLAENRELRTINYEQVERNELLRAKPAQRGRPVQIHLLESGHAFSDLN